jgi:uncharacterized membrane protein
MSRQTLKHLALSLAWLGFALSISPSVAQVGLARKRPGAPAALSPARAAAHSQHTPGATSYTYTLLSFPGDLYTYAVGTNKGAITTKINIVGSQTQGGFLVGVTGTKAVSEAYQTVNYPKAAEQVGASDINDLSQIVGAYIDSSGVYHGYERSSGKFTKIDVPFAGASGTFAVAINNSGEIVGSWYGSTATHAFTLIGATYTSLDYPAATATSATDINTAGEIVGFYTDASGVYHGYLLSGGTYSSFDPPGSVQTFATGINDAGDIVGTYCTTSDCVSTSAGEQGFLLSGGVFTTIAIAGEVATGLIDINNNGVIVGYYEDAAGLVVSFIATP